MKKIIFLLLFISVLIGITTHEMSKDYSDKIDEATKYVKVPVANKDIAKNQVINSDMIEIIDADETELTEDIIINTNQLIGKKATTNISKGSYFSQKDITNE